MDAGIIVMDKTADFTSFDVVAKLRGILHIKKIGHTGTLDPIATGVLVVCVGRATKLVSKLTAEEKIYEAGVLFGEKYDTGDITGKLIKNDSVVITEDDFRTACQQFVGDIDQIPPMYSAKKVNGKKLYEYAREGIEVEREPERIHIYSIELLGFDFPHAQIRVHCSKGTYIRTLCEDLGQKLGTGAAMEYLLRTRVGMFRLADARTLDEIEQLVSRDDADPYHLIRPLVMPVDAFFQDCPAGKTAPEDDFRLRNGNALTGEQLGIAGSVRTEMPERVRAYDSQAKFCGLYRWSPEKGRYMAEKMFL